MRQPNVKAGVENNLLHQIARADMCTSCGVCLHACPSSNISMELDQRRGAYGPRLSSAEKCQNCEANCLEVCPSHILDFKSLLEIEGRDGDVNSYGNIINIFVGHSASFQNCGRSSSGGIIKAILSYLDHESGSSIIALGETNPGIYQPMLIKGKENIEKLPGSIYHNLPFHGALELLRQAGGPCVLVALPCQLAGIKKYISLIEPELGKRLDFSIGLICGWMFSHHALKAFSRYKKISEEIQGYAYRGEDKVGNLKLFSASGVRTYTRRPGISSFSDYFDYHAAFSRYANLLRCRVCEDHLNMLADIAVGDAWLSRLGTKKESIIITRSPRGDALISAMLERDLVSLETGSLEDINESQSVDLALGNTSRALSRCLQKKHITTPRFVIPQNPFLDGVNSKTSFFLEMKMRKLLRTGWYKTFRMFYILLQMSMRLSRKAARLMRQRGI